MDDQPTLFPGPGSPTKKEDDASPAGEGGSWVRPRSWESLTAGTPVKIRSVRGWDDGEVYAPYRWWDEGNVLSVKDHRGCVIEVTNLASLRVQSAAMTRDKKDRRMG